MIHGLKRDVLDRIIAVVRSYPEVEKVIVYGSRAKGTQKPGSDIDLVLMGARLTSTHLRGIVGALDDLPIPFKCDVTLLHQITNQELIRHIERVGIVVYSR